MNFFDIDDWVWGPGLYLVLTLVFVFFIFLLSYISFVLAAIISLGVLAIGAYLLNLISHIFSRKKDKD